MSGPTLIDCAVGRDGRNLPEDVMTVQWMLNFSMPIPLKPLEVTGRVSPPPGAIVPVGRASRWYSSIAEIIAFHSCVIARFRRFTFRRFVTAVTHQALVAILA